MKSFLVEFSVRWKLMDKFVCKLCELLLKFVMGIRKFDVRHIQGNCLKSFQNMVHGTFFDEKVMKNQKILVKSSKTETIFKPASYSGKQFKVSQKYNACLLFLLFL